MMAASDVNVAQNVGFYIIAAVMIWGAFRVVTTKNVVHAALWLVMVLGGIAAQYILAAAEFVAVSQVLVYIALWILMPDERKYSTTVPGGESPDKRS